ncbi:LysR family transcriptional regulator [Aliihoeflea aestuarii]|jgi:DNA-binding transcriptional LysR family regulator|uniref:LysR family transcriptional regulator n=1 Tax=Aliihoeflea aestuarii TaxID=453840 RepID=UPI002093D45C|nr:LysR family transcriptional regulator [Aliihoeflea aestuarii]MCO6390112.1 LysR family transcriptional regulator [Aliihoeflea aestuarii]
MHFTLKQLRYVEAAGRTGSIVNAATELSISQSSITAAIDALEHDLGFDLFVRMPAKGIVATPIGRETIDRVRGFLEQARHLESDLRSMRGDLAGTLCIGCYVTTAPHVLPLILRGFARDYPNVGIDIFEGDMATVSEALSAGRVDVALTYQMLVPGRQGILPRDAGFSPLFPARPHAVISSDDPLARQEAVTLAELAELPMVLLDLPYATDYFMGLFRSHGLEPKVAHSTRSSEIVRALVSGGFGFSILNLRSLSQEVDAGFVTRPIRDDVGDPEYGVATLSGIRRPRIVDAFLGHCEKLRADNAFARLVVGKPAKS